MDAAHSQVIHAGARVTAMARTTDKTVTLRRYGENRRRAE
jgi:hypothetical protein